MAHILIVEDDAALSKILTRYLEGQGHDVRTAGTGKEAIKKLDGLDLVITDINMPDMDGIELIIESRDASPDIPVIAMSGGGLMDKRMLLSSARLLGAVRLLEKPFDLDTLEVAVMEVLRDHHSSTHDA